MRRFADQPLRRKLELLLTANAALALFVFGAATALLDHRQGEKVLAERTGAVAELLAANCAAAVVFQDADAARQTLATLAQDSSAKGAHLLGPGPRPFAAWSRAEPLVQLHAHELPSAAGQAFEGAELRAWRPVRLEGQVVGRICVHADPSRLREPFRAQLALGAASLLGALLLATLWARVLQRFVSEPVETLARIARRITHQGDYRLRVPRTLVARDEVGRLVGSFNAMLDQIELRDAALIRHRDELEQEIAHRTLALRSTNEALRRERDRAEAANAAKSEFLANMSHEIRTPMNGVLGMIGLTLEDGRLKEEDREHLRLARSSAEALLRLINDVLDFSKIEAGRCELESSPFDLHELLEEPVRLLAIEADRKGLELVLELDESLPAGVVGDAARLRQVVTNLLGNAVKFTEEGEVVVRAGADVLTEDELSLHLRVRDTGPGIDPRVQSTIFEAFEQGARPEVRSPGGTGLGLSICSRLARLMGGRTWVESAPGHGSTFHFTARLSLRRGEHAAAPGPDLELLGLASVVVDDNATSRTLIGAILSRAGMEVETAATAREALETLIDRGRRGEGADLVVVDARMPGLDGFWLAERIRKLELLRGATVLLLTPSMGAAEMERCRRLGVGAWLTKPVRRPELLAAARRALGLEPAEAAPEPERRRASAGLEGAEILVAEDNAVNRRLAQGLLEREGCRVTTVDDGLEAVRAFCEARERGRPPDLILMDVQMPRLDGLEATRRIRELEHPGEPRVPIVAATAFAFDSDARRCAEAGMDAHVPKPIERERLSAVLAELLGDRRGGSGEAREARTAGSGPASGDDEPAGGAPARGPARRDDDEPSSDAPAPSLARRDDEGLAGDTAAESPTRPYDEGLAGDTAAESPARRDHDEPSSDALAESPAASRTSSEDPAGSAPAASGGSADFDFAELLSRCGGDEALACELLELGREDLIDAATALEEAADQEAALIGRRAHALAGIAGNLAPGGAAARRARELEHRLRSGAAPDQDLLRQTCRAARALAAALVERLEACPR